MPQASPLLDSPKRAAVTKARAELLHVVNNVRQSNQHVGNAFAEFSDAIDMLRRQLDIYQDAGSVYFRTVDALVAEQDAEIKAFRARIVELSDLSVTSTDAFKVISEHRDQLKLANESLGSTVRMQHTVEITHLAEIARLTKVNQGLQEKNDYLLLCQSQQNAEKKNG